MNQLTADLMADLHFDLSPTEKVRNLSVAEQQLVEIAKALSHSDADIIIMDEPTSAIGEEDAQKIFDVITRLAQMGKGIIYVSHRLSEIFQIADTFSIFRDGTFITEGAIADITREQLIEHIIGGEFKDEFAKFNQPTNETILTVEQLSWLDKIKNISLTLKKGRFWEYMDLSAQGEVNFSILFSVLSTPLREPLKLTILN